MLIKFNNVYFIPEKFKLLSSGENRYILSDISFCIKDAMSAIVGPSGSGKSTIARMILGEIEPSSGNVEISPQGNVISAVFQNSVNLLNPYRTAGAQLQDVRKVVKNEGSFIIRYEYLIRELGISEQILEKKAGELSGGQRQRVAICRQLLFNPDLLVLDEPFSALDTGYKNLLTSLLSEYCGENNIRLICISHELEFLTKLCSYFIVVENGRIAEDGTLQAIRSNPVSKVTKDIFNDLAL